jgi:uncharacterized Zn finger protein
MYRVICHGFYRVEEAIDFYNLRDAKNYVRRLTKEIIDEYFGYLSKGEIIFDYKEVMNNERFDFSFLDFLDLEEVGNGKVKIRKRDLIEAIKEYLFDIEEVESWD